MPDEEKGSSWEAVIGRSLAYLCLQTGDLKSESLTKRAQFLKGLGLTTSDAASILNTSPASIYELFRQAKEAKGRKSEKRKAQDSIDTSADPVAMQLSRISSLLGLLATREMGEGDKIATLSASGFSNVEIGRLLSKTTNAVGVALFAHRKQKTKK